MNKKIRQRLGCCIIPSAAGERQILPRHTKRRDVGWEVFMLSKRVFKDDGNGIIGGIVGVL